MAGHNLLRAMKPQAAVVLLFFAVLGVLVWSFSGSGAAPAPTPGASDAGAPADGGAVDVARGAASAAAQAAQGVPTTAQPAGERTEVPSEPGSSSAAPMLRGRLVDAGGAPRPRLELVVSAWDLEGLMSPVVDAPGIETGRFELTTDAEGRFSFAPQGWRTGYLSLSADDLVFDERTRFEITGRDQDLGDLVVVAAASVRGVVQDEQGRPIEGVRVAVEQGLMGMGGSMSVDDSGEDGTFDLGKLRPGTWTLRSTTSQFLPSVVEQEVEAGQQVEGLVITLSPGAAVAGRVVDERGVGVAGMKVASRRKEQIGELELVRFSDREAATTDEQGRFRLAGLEGGRATIKAHGEGHTSATREVATGDMDVVLQVQRAGSIQGVLVNAAGAPIVGSRVRARATTKPGSAGALLADLEDFADIDLPREGQAVATTDAQGRFVLEGVAPGVVRVEAKGDEHLPTEQAGLRVLPAQRLEGIRLIADAGATASVEVVDEHGAPVFGADVQLWRAPRPQTPGMRFESRVEGSDLGGFAIADQRQLGVGVTDADGVTKISGLPRADAVVKVSHAMFASPTPPSLTLPASGVVSQRVVMLEPGFVDVTVARADGAAAAGTSVELEAIDASGPGEVEYGKADAEGKVRFGPLLAGRYTAVLARAPQPRQAGGMMMLVSGNTRLGSSKKEVTVTAGAVSPVTLELPVLARVSGRVLGVDGPMSGVVVELENADDEEEVLGFGGRRATSDGNGDYAFADVEPGRYEVRYAKPSAIVKAKLELDVPVNTAELSRDLVLRTGSVRVAVVTRDDAEPVERAEVRLVRELAPDPSGKPRRAQRVMMVSVVSDGEGESTSTMTFGNQRVVTDEDGVATFEDVPVGAYKLEVESRKYAPFERAGVEVVERQVTDLGTVEVAPAGQVRGVVEDQSGERVMSMVEHRLQGEEDWRAPEMAMQGSYRLRGLAPGRYEVRARALGAQAGEPSAPVLVEVVAGKTKVADLVVTR